MDQGLILNLNLTLRGYSKKFWGLFGEVAHITQQNFALASLPKWTLFIGQGMYGNISTNFTPIQ